MPKRKSIEIPEGDDAALCDELRQLREEVAVLRMSIDELREDMRHAVLNFERCPETHEPFRVTSMPLDPTCDDFAKRLNRFTAADLPRTDNAVQRQWEELKAAAEGNDWNVVRRLGSALLDHIGNGGEPPRIDSLEGMSVEDQREAAYDVVLKTVQAVQLAECSRAVTGVVRGDETGNEPAADKQCWLW